MEHCTNCEVIPFCSSMDRCLDQVVYDYLGETDMQDIDEISGQGELKRPASSNDIYKKPLTNQEADIIRESILSKS